MNAESTDQQFFAQPDAKKEWQGRYRDIAYRISLHSENCGYTPGGLGIWCFYLFLHENKIEGFDRIWLPDIAKRYTPVSPERISHDYYVDPLNRLELHGGITYYAKHGYTEGHRCVEVGCDYSHLWDHESGGGYDVNSIFHDVRKAIDHIYSIGLVKTAVKPTA